ncbi:MAG: carbonic anhydrase [Acidobacteria bacterium]|nr:MAG: carbonic anhydrase [Acidobacteriota bacterium]REJ99344.1 MAG: carbonic anhydrase [Acidobacteriota bacterium]REK16485.1 MAG: carbonic anhydrase [Acidobacteriota bacterium]REK44167.1 MAG: carbonic anhydrase [Acidobacteriota bacterium]
MTDDTGVQTKDSQSALSADDALKLLKEGNARFIDGKLKNQDNYRDQVSQTADGQYPFASILSCLDSRVGVEQIFDLNNGDAFVGRVAGNVMNPDMLGSFEFATKLAGSKLIVVLGHTQCGAVKGACDGAELGNLTGLLNRIEPAVDLVSKDWMDGLKSSKNARFVDAVVEANVRLARDGIVKESPVIKELVDEGKVKIVGAVYDLESGLVRFLS